MEISKACSPKRSYEKYPLSKVIKHDLIGKEFGYDYSEENISDQFKNYLSKHKKQFRKYQYLPSQSKKDENIILPKILNYNKMSFNYKKSSFNLFNFPKHNDLLCDIKTRIKKE